MLVGGASVVLPLPRLLGMLDANGTAYADGTPLQPRFLTWFFGNGIDPTLWVPEATGAGDSWQLSPHLQPLADLKSWLSVISGLEIKVPYLYAHGTSVAAVLTGAQAQEGAGVLAPTVDQIIAATISAGTVFPSGLHVGISDATGAAALGLSISYNGSNSPNPPEYSPTALFKTLVQFSNQTGEPDPSLLRRKRILDAVAEDAKSLRGRLGREDQIRLDQHLAGVDQLQSQIDKAMAPSTCGTPVDPDQAYPDRGEDGSITRARCQAFADLITFAFSCDLTRVATYAFTCSASGASYLETGLGYNSFHNDYGHLLHPDGPDYALEGFRAGVLYTMECLADLLTRFKNTPDGAGSLLDSSAIYVTSCVGQPWDHHYYDFPFLVIGKAGGRLRGDVHYRAEYDSASKVPFTLLQAFGVSTPSFGLDEGMVTEGIPDLLA
jgi:hypothetical protein